jgi:uncharacterized protein
LCRTGALVENLDWIPWCVRGKPFRQSVLSSYPRMDHVCAPASLYPTSSLRNDALSAYLDSSGFAKLFLPHELGTDIVRGTLHSANQPSTSMVTYAECRAALAAAVRSGRIDLVQCQQAVIVLDDMWLSLYRMSVNEAVVKLAGSLVDRHKLRRFDAIHLASAVSLGATTTMVTWDKDLAHAAHDEGLTTVPAWP